MELYFGGKYVYTEKVNKEKPKETKPEKAAKRLAHIGTHRNLQRYLKARRNFR